ncbi:uncharacterized mitochondrial protein-like protein [Tanacetum coccineum]
MWEAIKTCNLGADRIKEARLQTLIMEFENLKMSDNDTIDAYAAKLSGIASQSATLGEVMSEHKLVKNFLTSLPRCFVYIVAALEQVLDLKTTGFEDVVGLNIPTRIMTQTEEEDVTHTLEVVDEVEVKDMVRATHKTKVNSLKNHEDNEQKGKQHKKCDLSHIQCYCYDQYGHFVSKCHERNRNHEVNLNEAQEKGVYHEEGMFFMMNHVQETIFMNKEKYTIPKSESNTNDEDDVWYFNNSASNHMTGSYSYFSELNENITGRVRFGDGLCVSINRKGSILFQGKNEEQKLLKDVYYIPALRSNVISLGQATISGYDISIRGDFLTMRDSWGNLLIKVPRSANRLYKAQLKVGKEDTNVVGRELDESRSDDTPNPLVRLETIRLLIALAAEKGWKIHHLDVKTAFQNGNRKKLDCTLKNMDFLQCVHENTVYRKVPNGEFIIVAVNVDDLFVTGTSLDLINEFKKRMASQFEMLDLGELTYYLGIEVSQGKDCVEIKQKRYAMKILKEACMEECNPALCPMEPGLKLSKAEDEPEVEATQYQKMVGTTSFGIKYNRSNDMKLVGYSDSSHNVDIDDGRSTTGHVFYLGTSPITWCSQKQTTVALSSCEAEFMAATAAACQAIWLRELLAEVTGLERQKVIIRVDNKSAIALSKNPVFHGRSKHIHTRYHFIRECVENEQVIVEHVSGENQRADPLTKALARIRFKEMRSLLGVQELPSSTQKFRG